jgi:hypothetical protein
MLSGCARFPTPARLGVAQVSDHKQYTA